MGKEYIEREKLIRHLEDEIAGCEVPAGSRANGKSIAYGTELGLKMAKSYVETLPTADVVPRSEVGEIFEEIGKILYKYDKIAERDKSEYGELIVGDIGYAISELKKKYTEEKV